MPTKIYPIKMNDYFRLMLATVLLITHVSKNKEIECAKNEINAFKSQEVQFSKSQKLLPFHRADFRTLQ